MIDTGTGKNIMSTETFKNLKIRPQLEKSHDDRPLYGYGGKAPLDVVGSFTSQTAYNDVEIATTWYVVKGDRGTDSLLSFSSSKELGLVAITYSIASNLSEDVLHKYDVVTQTCSYS
ncbi:uncharacterized protein [Amphiura filiformis]|uniref:uncharacterized protein n=1 Tax=Amphiura filiformis TaxID=82378 RepID=UPI003B21518E